ncbi:MAG: DUF4389 domain-containing protein [Acidimicrobiales bacterium]
MQQVVFDVPYTEERNRLTTAFRFFLAIPHMILYGLWNRVTQLAAVIQWLICVFTGKRNKGIWDFTASAEAYGSRTGSYVGLMHDVFPPFLTEQGAVPSRYSLDYDETVNRLTVGLRIIWGIPAIVITAVIGIAAFFVWIASWFAILFTGKHPRGMFDFLLKFQRYSLQTSAYMLLLTDTYPQY